MELPAPVPTTTAATLAAHQQGMGLREPTLKPAQGMAAAAATVSRGRHRVMEGRPMHSPLMVLLPLQPSLRMVLVRALAMAKAAAQVLMVHPPNSTILEAKALATLKLALLPLPMAAAPTASQAAAMGGLPPPTPQQSPPLATQGVEAQAATLPPPHLLRLHMGEAGVQVGVAWVAPRVQGVTASPASPLLL